MAHMVREISKQDHKVKTSILMFRSEPLQRMVKLEKFYSKLPKKEKSASFNVVVAVV
jgi:hypothetical protein